MSISRGIQGEPSIRVLKYPPVTMLRHLKPVNVEVVNTRQEAHLLTRFAKQYLV